MKMYEKIKSMRRIKRSLLIVLVLLLAMVGFASAAPSASIAYSIVSGTTNAPLGVQFQGSSDDPNVNWTWDFAEPGGSSTFQNASYTFLYAGVHTVTLTVRDLTTAESGVASQSITVNSYPDFATNQSEGFANLTVHFTDASTGHPLVWNWTFGDGEVHNGVDSTVDHTYIKSGKFSSNVNVTANAIKNQSANKIITVNPLAAFTINPSAGNVSSTFSFNGTSTGTPVVNYTWNYGNGVPVVGTTTGSTDNRTYSGYTVAKTYYPNLTVYGQSGTTSGVITKSLPVSPVAKIDVSASNPVEGRPVFFYDISLGDIKNQTTGTGTWLWEFGDGTTSTLQNTTHIYKAGKYTARLTVTKNGLSDSTTKVINADSGNLYLLRSGINGNTYYFNANKYGIYLSQQSSITFIAYPTRSMSRFLSDQQSIGTTYEWKFYGANTGTILESPIQTVPKWEQPFTIPDIYTVQLNVTDSRETYTVTKPRLVVVRGTGVT